jgi:hypothetical protein
MKRKLVARALTLVRELEKVLASLSSENARIKRELPPAMKSLVEAKICLVCKRQVVAPEPYRRGRCASHYQQFINDKLDDPNVEKRYISAGTITPWAVKGGRPRKPITTADIESAEKTGDASKVSELGKAIAEDVIAAAKRKGRK